MLFRWHTFLELVYYKNLLFFLEVSRIFLEISRITRIVYCSSKLFYSPWILYINSFYGGNGGTPSIIFLEENATFLMMTKTEHIKMVRRWQMGNQKGGQSGQNVLQGGNFLFFLLLPSTRNEKRQRTKNGKTENINAKKI